MINPLKQHHSDILTGHAGYEQAHSASWHRGFQLWVVPYYLPKSMLSPSSCLLLQGADHPVQSLHQMDVGSSQCPEQLGQTKPKVAMKGVNVWQHQKRFFLPRFSNLSSHSCFKSLMLLLDTYSSFVLLVFVRSVVFFYYYYWRGICDFSYLQVWFCFQFSSLASSVLGNVISAQLILFTQFTWHTHTNSHSYLGHLANCRLYTYIKWYFLSMICLEHWYNYCKKNHNNFIIH